MIADAMGVDTLGNNLSNRSRIIDKILDLFDDLSLPKRKKSKKQTIK